MSLILIHGLGQSASSWDKTLGFMKAESPPHCPDLFSLTDYATLDYKSLYAAFSAYVNEKAENAQTEKLDLYGLCLGGILAMNYYLDNPEKVRSLTLIAVQYKTPKTMMKVQNFIFRLLSDKSFKQIGLTKKSAISLCSSMLDLDLTDRLKDIKCPTLVLCGKKDSINLKVSRELANLLPDAEFLAIADAAHEVTTDTPEKLAEIFCKFYEKQQN